MKENKALLFNPGTAIEEATKWTDRYGLVICPSQDLRKSTVIFSLNYEIIQAMSDRMRPIPSGNFGLPSDIVTFFFGNHYAAITFLAKHHIIIGYDHIDDLNE